MNIASSRKGSNGATKLLLFLVSPLLALFYSLKDLNSKSSLTVIYWFSVFLGFSLYYTTDNHFDGIFIAVEFEKFSSETLSSYLRMVSSFFSFDNPERIKDLYGITVKFLVSRVTDNYHFFFAVVALVFSFFMIKTLKFFSSIINYSHLFPWVILLYIFFYPQFFAINGVRFGTAGYVFLFSLFSFFVNKEKKYLYLLFLTPLIHISFVFSWVVLLVFLLSRRFENFWVLMLFLSYLLSEVTLNFLRDNIIILPFEFLLTWVDNYISYDSSVVKSSGFTWLVPFFSFLSRAFNLGLMIIIIHNKKVVKNDIRTKKMFSFLLIWYTFSNLMYSVPSLGSRFMALSSPFIAYIWMVHFINTRFRSYLYIYPIVNILTLKNVFDIYTGLVESSFLISPFINLLKYTLSYEAIPISFTY